MDFFIADKKEALEAATSAEFTGGNYVDVHGAYAGIIENCCFKKFASGAGGVEVTIKTEEGLLCRVMVITMTKEGKSTYEKDGKTYPLPGVNQIRGGLMAILQQKELKALKKSDTEIVYPGVIGKTIGMLVDIVKSHPKDKKTGVQDLTKTYTNADLKSFYHPATGKTASELLDNQPAVKVEKIKANLKTVEPVVEEASTGAGSKSDPFGDAGTGAADPFAGQAGTAAADPFNQPAAQTPAAQEPVQQQVAQEPVAQTPAVQEPAVQAQPETPAATTPAATETPASATGGDDFWG